MVSVILSTTVVFDEGIYIVRVLSLDEAKAWVAKNSPKNYCVHPTVRILGIEPEHRRESCNYYDEALIAKPRRRLDGTRNYTLEEIASIGVNCFLIKRIGRPT